MKQTITLCDRCGHQLSKGGHLLLHLTVPHVRVIAEDDTTESESVDLCAACGAIELGAFLKALPITERPAWVQRVRKVQEKELEDQAGAVTSPSAFRAF